MKFFDLKDRVIIVTGSSGGNGSAIVKGLEHVGAVAVKADLPEYDITSNKDLDSLIEVAMTYGGEIHGLVNCAGVTYGNSLFDYLY